MLQNRVDPWGNIIKTSARGAWMGNRGVIHNEHQQVLYPFKHKAWIICLLEFKGRRRKVMTPRRWTELFFLDEATAFSAGHRPCFECRRQDAGRFRSCWVKGNPGHGFDETTSIREIDNILHQERIDSNKAKPTYAANIEDLPDGVVVVYEGKPSLVAGAFVFPWSPFGYDDGIARSGLGRVQVLTPRSMVNAFRAGYRPQMAVKE